MRHLIFALIAVPVILGATAVPRTANAHDGEVAAGVAGGLLGGLLLGGALAPRPPVYVEPTPVYVEPAPRCYWTRGEPYWDDWRGVWRRQRIRVCD